MSNSIKVSIIIPVYNVEKYLRECLDSATGQTLSDIEIICVDDGSRDSSGAIADEYAAADSRVISLHRENGGQSAARNDALKIARGEYFYFLDSDDYIDKNAMEQLYHAAKSDELDVLYFDGESFFENDKLKNSHKNYKDYYKRETSYDEVTTGPEKFRDMANDFAFRPSPCLQLIRASHMRDNGLSFEEGIIFEDNLFTFKCALTAKRARHISAVYFHRRIRENSVMTHESHTVKDFIGYFTCITEAVRFLEGRQFDYDVVDAAKKFMSTLTGNARMIFWDLDEDHQNEVMEKLPDDAAVRMLFFLTIRGMQQDMNIRKSASYKIGHGIVKTAKIIFFVPWKLVRMIRSFIRNGAGYTMRGIARKFGR